MATGTPYRLGLCTCGDVKHPFYISSPGHNLPNEFPGTYYVQHSAPFVISLSLDTSGIRVPSVENDFVGAPPSTLHTLAARGCANGLQDTKEEHRLTLENETINDEVNNQYRTNPFAAYMTRSHEPNYDHVNPGNSVGTGKLNFKPSVPPKPIHLTGNKPTPNRTSNSHFTSGVSNPVTKYSTSSLVATNEAHKVILEEKDDGTVPHLAIEPQVLKEARRKLKHLTTSTVPPSPQATTTFFTLGKNTIKKGFKENCSSTPNSLKFERNSSEHKIEKNYAFLLEDQLVSNKTDQELLQTAIHKRARSMRPSSNDDSGDDNINVELDEDS